VFGDEIPLVLTAIDLFRSTELCARGFVLS
jgi:hypothetical protein